jgi:hypothetical protein
MPGGRPVKDPELPARVLAHLRAYPGLFSSFELARALGLDYARGAGRLRIEVALTALGDQVVSELGQKDDRDERIVTRWRAA